MHVKLFWRFFNLGKKEGGLYWPPMSIARPSKRLFTLLFILLAPFWARAEDEPQSAPHCSVITVAPGDSLDALFGHTAIRIRDARLKDIFGEEDVWFDYGVFDPSDWTFWIHYAKGDAKYLLVAARAQARLENYKEEGRAAVEQELNLKPEEGRKLENYLIENLRHPEYEYRFLDDNCTTRAKVAIEYATGEKLEPSMWNWSYRRFYRCQIASKYVGTPLAPICSWAITLKERQNFFASPSLPFTCSLLESIFIASPSERKPRIRIRVGRDSGMGLMVSMGQAVLAISWSHRLSFFFSSPQPSFATKSKSPPPPRLPRLHSLPHHRPHRLPDDLPRLLESPPRARRLQLEPDLVLAHACDFRFLFLFAAHGKTPRLYARIACIGASVPPWLIFSGRRRCRCQLFPLVLFARRASMALGMELQRNLCP